MENDYVTIVFKNQKAEKEYDLVVPLNISAHDLVIALNSAFELNIDVSDIKNCYLSADKPLAFLRGEKTLKEHGIRNGSVVSFNG